MWADVHRGWGYVHNNPPNAVDHMGLLPDANQRTQNADWSKCRELVRQNAGKKGDRSKKCGRCQKKRVVLEGGYSLWFVSSSQGVGVIPPGELNQEEEIYEIEHRVSTSALIYEEKCYDVPSGCWLEKTSESTQTYEGTYKRRYEEYDREMVKREIDDLRQQGVWDGEPGDLIAAGYWSGCYFDLTKRSFAVKCPKRDEDDQCDPCGPENNYGLPPGEPPDMPQERAW